MPTDKLREPRPRAPIESIPTTPPLDPKAATGGTKPNLGLVPSIGSTLASLAFEDGARKYGSYNFRGHLVEVMTYVSAARRHLDAWVDGEDFTSDTGVPNLGAVIACVTIILDAMACGTAVDNRPPPGSASIIQDAVKEWKQAVADGDCPVEASTRILGPVMGLKVE